jgi:hypothetical protein
MQGAKSAGGSGRVSRRAVIKAGAGATVAAFIVGPRAAQAETGVRATTVPVSSSEDFTRWTKSLPQPRPDDRGAAPPPAPRSLSRPRLTGTRRPQEGRRS